MTSEMTRRETEARKVATKCETVRDFAMLMKINMEAALHWNAELALGLPAVRERERVRHEGQAVPKPKPRK